MPYLPEKEERRAIGAATDKFLRTPLVEPRGGESPWDGFRDSLYAQTAPGVGGANALIGAGAGAGLAALAGATSPWAVLPVVGGMAALGAGDIAGRWKDIQASTSEYDLGRNFGEYAKSAFSWFPGMDALEPVEPAGERHANLLRDKADLESQGEFASKLARGDNRMRSDPFREGTPAWTAMRQLGGSR